MMAGRKIKIPGFDVDPATQKVKKSTRHMSVSQRIKQSKKSTKKFNVNRGPR